MEIILTSEPAEVMFKKVMEIPDDMIIKYYELATDVHPDEIENIKLELASGANPRDIKLRLAKMITALYHTPGDEEKAVKYYDMAFSKKTIPDDIPTMVIEMDKDKVYDVLPQLIDMIYQSKVSLSPGKAGRCSN